MPKRQAIVPQMARAPKRSKKKKAIAEASNNEDEPLGPEAEEDQRPTAEAGELLSLVHEQAPEATGHAIVSLPDAADIMATLEAMHVHDMRVYEHALRMNTDGPQ